MKLRLIPLFLIGIYATGSMAAPAAGVPAASDKALPVLASVPGTPAAAAAPAPAADRITEVITAELPAPNIDVWTRIRNGFKIPTLESARVETQVAAISRHPESFAKTATRAGMYLYHIVGQVEARGMPMELALLPFVESSFRPNALSSAKASGLWQFIPSTGTTYSLNQNLWKDERRDVVESTRAALDYFQKLYAQFGDWQLALAAYNWGEGNVQRAIDRNAQAGLPTDYSHLRMPLETANYVPRLEAVKRIIQNPSAYGVTLPDIGSEPYFVQVFRDKDIDVKTAARLANMKLDDFKLLNPSFNKPVIVGAHNTAMLRSPRITSTNSWRISLCGVRTANGFRPGKRTASRRVKPSRISRSEPVCLKRNFAKSTEFRATVRWLTILFSSSGLTRSPRGKKSRAETTSSAWNPCLPFRRSVTARSATA